jgi:hypothetical protein
MQPTWFDAEHASAQALRAHPWTVEAAVTHVVLQVAFKSILLEAQVVCPLRRGKPGIVGTSAEMHCIA